MRQLRLEFYHDGEQVYYWQNDTTPFMHRLKIAWLIILGTRPGQAIRISYFGGPVTRKVGGREYKL